MPPEIDVIVDLIAGAKKPDDRPKSADGVVVAMIDGAIVARLRAWLADAGVAARGARRPTSPPPPSPAPAIDDAAATPRRSRAARLAVLARGRAPRGR